MRTIIFFIWGLLGIVSTKAQLQESFSIPYYYFAAPEEDKSYTDVLYFINAYGVLKEYNQGLGIDACDGGPCKTGVYQRINYQNSNRIPFYAVGGIERKKYKTGVEYSLSGPVEIYYAENDQLFVKKDYSPSLVLKNDIFEMFWSNGNPMYQYLYEIDSLATRRTVRLKSYHENGKLYADILLSAPNGKCYFPVFYNQEKKGASVYSRSFGNVMAHEMKYPGYLDHGAQGSYLGYRYHGTYYTPEGVSLTGFIWPMIESMGNGSVVYVEEANGVAPYFAIYFNGKIDSRYKVPMTKDPLKFMQELDANTVKSYSQIDGPYYDKRSSQPMLDLQTKNIDQHTGYGIDYSSSENGISAYTRTMRVGFFKDGKLDGLGYQVRITQDFNYQGLVLNHQDVEYAYGFYKNGVLVDGQSDKLAGDFRYDNWTRPSNPNIKFSSREAPPEAYLFNGPDVSYNFIWGEMYPELTAKIYAKSVNRYFTFVDVDKEAKQIIVQGFYDEGKIRLDAKDDLYLLKQLTPSSHVESCWYCEGDGIVTETGYTTEYVPGGFVQEGLYYTYIYSYEKAVKKKIYYEAQCPKCKGKGKLDVGNVDIQFELRKIKF